MDNQLFIPNKIKVGYQEREDTYTKRLAYVIYYDLKGVLRKEQSWKGWIDKGDPKWVGEYPNQKMVQTRDPLPTHDFDNVPLEGFVLNKKAGGYSSGWNHRATYCRVYDPRGFEFEISIENLLFILQECTSSKGKGLEGEYVYAWDGKDLVLLPAHCEEYVNSRKFTDLKTQKVAAKDLIPGAVYETKQQTTLVYLGKFPWYDFEEVKTKGDSRYERPRITSMTKSHIFYDNTEQEDKFVVLDSMQKLANCKSDVPVGNFAELMEELSNQIFISPPVGLICKDFSPEYDFKEDEKGYYSYFDNYLYREINPTTFIEYQLHASNKYDSVKQTYVRGTYTLSPRRCIIFKDGKITITSGNLESYNHNERLIQNDRFSMFGARSYEQAINFTKSEVLAKGYQELFVNLENGKEINFKNYKS